VTELGSNKAFNELQPEKANCPMLVTDFGIVKVTSELQL